LQDVDIEKLKAVYWLKGMPNKDNYAAANASSQSAEWALRKGSRIILFMELAFYFHSKIYASAAHFKANFFIRI